MMMMVHLYGFRPDRATKGLKLHDVDLIVDVDVDIDVDVDVDQAFRDQVQRAEAAGRATDKHCPPLQRGCPIHRGGARKWR